MQQSYTERWQTENIRKALKSFRVVILAGPRQCGKTTLAKQLKKENIIYRTLDDTTLLQAALENPHDFIRHNQQLLVIDEIQRAPLLLQAIKKEVDENPQPGRFLLTGSANIQALPNVSESLAGRVRKIRLRPFTQAEVYHKSAYFLECAFAEKLSSMDIFSHYNKDFYLIEALKGGYPEPRLLSANEAKLWHKSYLNALMERDLKDIVQIRRQHHMNKLLEILAAWSSKFMDIASIGSNLGLSRITIESYINALEALYLIDRVKPWAKTDYLRVNKHDKLFFNDTGLMSAILQWKLDKIRFDGEINGKLLETFVFNQLAAMVDYQDDIYDLYHYRDREKREIDFIIENSDNELLGIEVKAGSTVTKDSFKYLKWFNDNLAKERKFIGIVLYTGEHILRFDKNMWVVPIQALWY